MKDVILWTGAGQIGMAIARRTGYGKKIVVGDKNLENAKTIAKIMNEAGFDVAPVEMDLSSRNSILNLIEEGQKYGEIAALINVAGVSPSQAPVETSLLMAGQRRLTFMGQVEKKSTQKECRIMKCKICDVAAEAEKSVD